MQKEEKSSILASTVEVAEYVVPSGGSVGRVTVCVEMKRECT